MSFASNLVNIPMKLILHTFMQVDDTEVAKIPAGDLDPGDESHQHPGCSPGRDSFTSA
jgi:hypothetical protein